MEGLFKQFQNVTTKAAEKFLDVFDPNKDTVAGKTAKTVGDYFAPTPEVRVRDLVRETPNALAEVVGRPILRSFAALGKKINDLDIRATYEPKTEYEKSLFGTDQGINFTSIGKEARLADNDAKTIPILDPTVGAVIALLDAPTGGRTAQTVRGTTKATKVAFTGAKNLTTKVLDGLKGKTFVSRQFIEDLLKRPDVKQAERDLITDVLKTQPTTGKIQVQQFADSVEDRLLPLTNINLTKRAAPNEIGGIRYPEVNLPEEQRGINYVERIYEGPVQTKAIGYHFDHLPIGQGDKYFAHARLDEVGDTRRVLEMQSDLFQKGRLQEEIDETKQFINAKKAIGDSKGVAYGEKIIKELETLAPYRNTWWQRITREEMRQAALDGKTELLFPTGKTAMQIEGLAGRENPWMAIESYAGGTAARAANDIGPEDIVAGKIVTRNDAENLSQSDQWIIIDDTNAATGQFKAVPKKIADEVFGGNFDLQKAKTDGTLKKLRSQIESFTIADNVDVNNPIFKFYEDTLAKYLKNRYGAERFTDERGVQWWRVKVQPEAANQPVEAFAGGIAGLETDEETGEVTGFNPLAGLIGAGAFALARKTRGIKPGAGHSAKVLREVDESSVLLETTKGGNPIQTLKMPEDPTAVFYHGTSKADAESIIKKGFPKNTSALHVGDLTEAGMYGDSIIEVRPAIGAKIKTIDVGNPKWEQLAKLHKTQAEIHRAAKAAGYDAIYAGNEIEILNPDKFEMQLKGSKPQSVADVLSTKKLVTDHPINKKTGVAEVPYSTRLDEAYRLQESEDLIKDAKSMSYEDFVRKYEAYNFDRGGMSKGTKPAHAVIPRDRLIPTEHYSWETMTIATPVKEIKKNGKARQPDIQRAKKEVQNYMQKSFMPPLVEDLGDGTYAVIDGHHRIYNLMLDGTRDVPVYLDRRSLKNIWEKYSGKKVDNKKADALYNSFPAPEKTSKTVGDIIKPPTDTPVSRAELRPKRDERRFTTRTRALEPGTSQFLDGAKDTRSTDKLITQADEIIDTDIKRAESMAKTGTDDLSVAVASRLIDRLVNQASKATDTTTKEALWEQAAAISNDAARNLTENGRAVQAATILGRNTPEGMVRFAARMIQKHNEIVERMNQPVNKTVGGIFGTPEGKQLKRIPELTAEQAEQIVTRMREIDNLPTEEAKSIALQELMDTVIKPLVPDSLLRKIVTVWKAGLLTGFKTIGLNIGSNISHFGLETIKDVPAALVDRITAIFTGKRTLAATNRGLPSGAMEGIKRGWTYFKTGYDARDVAAKLDYRRVHMGNSKLAKAIQLYEETVFKIHGTQDQPFYYAAKARSLYSQAIAQAKNKGLRGKEASTFINNLVANPTDEMLRYATLDAETMVFQNRTALGNVAKGIQRLGGGAGEILLPFGKTPSAVVTQIINYTPVGAVAAIARGIKNKRFDQRLFSQQMGRAITGTGAIYLGSQLYKEGMMNLNMPTSEREREQWRMEGRIPNSINMGDGRWRNPIVFGPAGNLLILGGQIQRGIEETGSFIGGLATAAPGIVGTITEQTFLTGINQALDAMKDPERSWQGFSSSLAGSIVPTLIADIARATDDFERDAPTPSTRIQSRIPGLRQNTEPRVNAFGDALRTPNTFEVMFDSTRPGVAQIPPDEQRLVRELRRLADNGYLVTPTPLVPRNGYKSLSPKQNTNLRSYAGQAVKRALEETMQDPNYLQMDDEMRADAIDKAVKKGKVEARAYMVQSVTKGLSGASLNQRLAELKEDGILTQQVYNRYLQLTQ